MFDSLGVSNFEMGGRIHHITPLDMHRIRIAGRNLTISGDIPVELDMHQPVIFQRIHPPSLGSARFEKRRVSGIGT